MEENQIFNAAPVLPDPGQKPMQVSSLVLGILSIVFGLLIAIIGDILGIVGLVLAIVKRKELRTTPGMVCSIVGLVLAITNHIIACVLISAIL